MGVRRLLLDARRLRSERAPAPSGPLHRRVSRRHRLSLQLRQPARQLDRRLERGLPQQRIPSHPARVRRRLSLQERPGAPHDAVRDVLDDDPAQRLEPGEGPMGLERRVSLHLGGVRRLPHPGDERHQRPSRHLHVVRGALELLQLRQLDLPTFVRFFEYALVLRRRARSDLSEQVSEDRAVDREWLAVVRQIQRGAGRGPSNSLESDGVVLCAGESVFRHRHARRPRSQAHPYRRQRDGALVPQAGRRVQSGRGLAHAGRGMRVRRRQRGRWHRHDHLRESVLPRVHGLHALLVPRQSRRPDGRRRRHHQPRPLPRAGPPDQWGKRVLGRERDHAGRLAGVHGERGRSVPSVGHAADRRLHAEPVHHVSSRVQSPRREHSVFHGARRNHALRERSMLEHRRARIMARGRHAGAEQQRSRSRPTPRIA